MDIDNIKLTNKILKKNCFQQKYSNSEVKKDLVDKKIFKGIRQLDKNEGTGFGIFLNE